MKYVILLTAAAIVMIASSQSGILNVNAISAKDIREHLQGIDEDQILRAFESLKSGESGSYGYGAGFILILVLFILLVIIGAGFGTSDISGDEERQELSADVQSGGYIPLMTMEP